MRNLATTIATLSCILLATHSQDSPMDPAAPEYQRSPNERALESISTNPVDSQPTLKSVLESSGQNYARMLANSGYINSPPIQTNRRDLTQNFNPTLESVIVIDIDLIINNLAGFFDKINELLQKARKLIVLKREAIKQKNLWSDYFQQKNKSIKNAKLFFIPVCAVKRSANESICFLLSVENIYLVYGFLPKSMPSNSSTFSGLINPSVKRRLLFFDKKSRALFGKSNLTANDLKQNFEPLAYAALGLFAANPSEDPVVLFNNLVKDKQELQIAAIPGGRYGPNPFTIAKANSYFSALLQFINGKVLSSSDNAKNIQFIEFWAKLIAESVRNQNFFEKIRGSASFVIPGGAVPWDAEAIYAHIISASKDKALIDKLKKANTRGSSFLINIADGLNLISIYL